MAIPVSGSHHVLFSMSFNVPCPRRTASRQWLLMVLSLLVLAFALGTTRPSHAQFSYPREQTKLDITITAEAGVNPDDKGRAAPILVRIYELKSEGVFEAADYFSLSSNDKALIGSELLVRDEFILRPGDVKTIRRKSHPDLAAIGVVAGYRDLAQADWRAVQKIDPAPEVAWYRSVLPANKLKLQIDLQAKGIQLTPLK
ncbi:type VI secretion system protein VasD [Variovorax boronicumulans]|uniref:type VI secretion system lipoprotein TssJ n=1 Tax=Variovorax boronicumulans TaxID=436515 RepID=UPI002781FA4F|nr:type VI secretion system lipoprotein TssJ [Variovorax boronicumulans]MDQ0038267.1 type VI secretion system protein VasD [Variovorax boronicumulans]